LAKSLHSQKVSITWAENVDQKPSSVLVPGNTVYPEVPRCKIQIEKIGVSRVDTKPTACGLDAQVRNLLRIGEEAMKKAY